MTLEFPALTPWQSDVYKAMEGSKNSGKIFVVKAKRQVGKSIIAAIEAIKFAVENPCKNIILEPTLVQCRRVFKDICSWIQDTPIVEGINKSALEISFKNGSEIIFKSAEQKDRLRGYTVTGLLVIDEAAFIPDEIIDIVFPWTDANRAPTLFISTPLFKEGRFYELFTSADNKISFSFDWAKYDTSQFLDESKLDYYRKNLTELKFRSEYLGEFITDGSFVFNNIDSMFKQNIQPINKQTFIGIDWGSGKGQDYTAVTTVSTNKDGVQILDIQHFNNLPANQQVDLIADYINHLNGLNSILVEENSIGKVFMDELKSKLKSPSKLKGFTTTNQSKRKIIEQLVQLFNKELIVNFNKNSLSNKELIVELQHYAVVKLQSTITYNALPGFHDDIVMSLAIAIEATNLFSKTKYNLKFK